MSEMLGYSREELIGRSGMDFVDAKYKAYSEQRVEKKRQGINEIHENKLIRKDGSFFWVLANSKPIFNKDGRFAGVLSMITDITERKQAEEALRQAYEALQAQSEELQAQSEELQVQNEELKSQSEELREAYETLMESENRFRSSFDDSAVGMALIDPDARFLRINDALCRLLGFEKSEIEGHSVLNYTYPDDIRPSILAHKSVIDGEKASLRIEKRYIRKDGQVIICDVSSSPVLDAKGSLIYTVAHIQDITQRKQV
jgi:PAS domain S-box-containing protein